MMGLSYESRNEGTKNLNLLANYSQIGACKAKTHNEDPNNPIKGRKN
jgi:hypothetical protein